MDPNFITASRKSFAVLDRRYHFVLYDYFDPRSLDGGLTHFNFK